MMLLLHPPSPARSCVLGDAAAAWAVCLVQRWDDVYDCTTARLHDCKLRLQQLRQVFSTSCALCCHCCCGLLSMQRSSAGRTKATDGSPNPITVVTTICCLALKTCMAFRRILVMAGDWLGYQRCSPSACSIQCNVFGIIFDLLLFRTARPARCMQVGRAVQQGIPQFSILHAWEVQVRSHRISPRGPSSPA